MAQLNYAILTRPITQGGFGRNLTSRECKKLRLCGIPCSERYIVVRQVHDIQHLGRLYKPSASGSGYDNVGVCLSQ